MDKVNGVVCPRCKAGAIDVGDPVPPHGNKARCRECGQFWWIKKEKNDGKRVDKNDEWRRRWREMGPFLCAICLIIESQTASCFYAHHINPLREEGGTGEDVFENTYMLCAQCHEDIHSTRKRVRDILRKAGQNGLS